MYDFRCVHSFTVNLQTDYSKSYDFILSTNGQIVPEDLSPSLQKITEVEDGFVLHNVSGIRTHIVSRLDRKGYDITKRKYFEWRSTAMIHCLS